MARVDSKRRGQHLFAWQIVFACLFLIPAFVALSRSIGFSARLAILILALFLGVLAVGTFLRMLDRLLHSHQRAQRTLSNQSGNGISFLGCLDSFGLTWNNQADGQLQQFSWAVFPHVEVDRDGIVLRGIIDQTNWILPAQSIQGYDATTVAKAVSRLRSQAAGPAILQVVPNLTERPDQAILFENYFLNHGTDDSRRSVMKGMAVLGNWFGIVGLVLSISLGWTNPVVFGFIIILVASLIAFFYFGAAELEPGFVVRQWGWVGSEGFRATAPGRQLDLSWRDVAVQYANDGGIEIRNRDGRAMMILRPDDLLDDDEQPIDDAGRSWSRVLGFIPDLGDSDHDAGRET